MDFFSFFTFDFDNFSSSNFTFYILLISIIFNKCYILTVLF